MSLTRPSLEYHLSDQQQDEPQRGDAQLQAIAALALEVAESLDLPVVLDQVAQRVAALFGGVCQVRFTPVRRPADARRVVASPLAPPAACAESAAADTYATLLTQLDAHLLPEAERARDDRAGAGGGAELLLAPLIARGRRIGLIDLVLPARDDSAIAHHQGMLRALAPHMALAIDNADQVAQLRLDTGAGAGAARTTAESLSPLLSLVAHDLRGPLSSLSASVQLLVRLVKGGQELDQSKLARLSELAEAAVGQLERQICALTSTPATNSTRGEQPEQRVDLVTLTRLMANFYQATTGRHQISVSADLAELPCPWPRSQIERVLGNLLTNAIKYSPTGGEIQVSVGRAEATSGSWATLRVQSHGIGIPSQDLPQVAQAGYRARNVGAIPGTGFGLASVREVVEQYGGTFALQSALGGSTTIEVSLPLG